MARLEALGLLALSSVLTGCDLFLTDYKRVDPTPSPATDASTGSGGENGSDGSTSADARNPVASGGAGGTRGNGGNSALDSGRQREGGDASPMSIAGRCDAGTACGTDTKHACDGSGRCVDRCADGLKDGDETDIDCGGPDCAGCQATLRCAVNDDCAKHLCVLAPTNPPAMRCSSACNTDGVSNGGESGIDCGARCSKKCALGSECGTEDDCASGRCVDGVCCGTACSGACERCEAGSGACVTVAAGELAPRCAGNGATCDANGLCASCSNGKLDDAIGETGVDCGGAECPPCATGGTCISGSDCASCICEGNQCQAKRCIDHRRDGCESDVDCGGVCGPCGIGQTCSSKADCASASCSSGKCVP